jgi:hypothetical protein
LILAAFGAVKDIKLGERFSLVLKRAENNGSVLVSLELKDTLFPRQTAQGLLLSVSGRLNSILLEGALLSGNKLFELSLCGEADLTKIPDPLKQALREFLAAANAYINDPPQPAEKVVPKLEADDSQKLDQISKSLSDPDLFQEDRFSITGNAVDTASLHIKPIKLE